VKQDFRPTLPLDDEQLSVLRDGGTEAPFSGKYLRHDDDGMYTCAACGAQLFASDQKYESDLPGLEGWPSFGEAVSRHTVELRPDDSHGMSRTEVLCANCGGHLGHVFDDASSPTGKHYCINSVCLGFKPQDKNSQG
jgi:peptide-methionine (R)-S-oxide reductase